jgi:UDP-N-acetylmuramoyl-L-alanyl-D-glutamate--2,6-diaminopimelate ligase
LTGIGLIQTVGNTAVEVNAIVFDSRNVTEGVVFVASKGTTVDGHQFIDKAIELGAKVVLLERMPAATKEGITYLQVENSNVAMGLMAANFYGNPSRQMKVIGVTGTNGKTTNVTLLHHLFRKLGYDVGMLSTVQNQINETVLPATHTTPDAVTCQALMAKMLAAGCQFCFMEVSSHAIEQARIAGIEFAGAIFTNITHDHLDYHLTFDNYIKAKKKLFDQLPATAFALVNVDDKNGKIMLQNTAAKKYTFALKTIANFKAKLMGNTLHGLQLEVQNKEVWFKLIGSFNAYNLLGVYAAAVLLGENEDDVLTELSGLDTAKGRFEQVISKNHVTGIVDYAHTPDALENVLTTIADLKGEGKVITVVGCGGNRDAAKRPIMAEIACKYSDKVILTSDNPRNEAPEAILAEMQKGVSIQSARKVLTILDRREAIKTACMLANEHDIILLAGKGHENYQEIKGVKHHFDDKEELMRVLSVEL